jgi:hypothetical protein
MSMWVKSLATPATIAPIVNHAIATSTNGFRPNKSDNEENTGWKTKQVLAGDVLVSLSNRHTGRAQREGGSGPECFDCGSSQLVRHYLGSLQVRIQTSSMIKGLNRIPAKQPK